MTPFWRRRMGCVAIREPVDDLYAELGVGRTATRDEIAVAFRARARELHPDAHPGDAPAAERFKRVSMAYQVLSDPVRRARYDSGRPDSRPGDPCRRSAPSPVATSTPRPPTGRTSSHPAGGALDGRRRHRA